MEDRKVGVLIGLENRDGVMSAVRVRSPYLPPQVLGVTVAQGTPNPLVAVQIREHLPNFGAVCVIGNLLRLHRMCSGFDSRWLHQIEHVADGNWHTYPPQKWVILGSTPRQRTKCDNNDELSPKSGLMRQN